MNRNRKWDTPRRGVMQGILAAVVVSGFFVTLTMMFLVLNDNESRDARLLMLGALTAGFSTVLGYYFGSTSGSLTKTELLANSTPTPPTPVSVTTMSEQGLAVTTLAAATDLAEMQAKLNALRTKGVATPEDMEEEARLVREIDALRNPLNPNESTQ